jgi:hypothetical protein
MSDQGTVTEVNPPREAIKQRRTDVSARVSETTRYIGFGLLATFYAIISGNDAFFVDLRSNWPLPLRLMALCGAVTILLDYLHYVFGYLTTERVLDRPDKKPLYNTAWPTYRAEIFCFWAKQVAAFAGCCLLIFLVVQGF